MRQERAKAEESFRSKELHLKSKETELDKLKNSLEQQQNDLKIQLYTELQEKEHELFDKLAAAKEEMYRALNTHREVLDKEHEARIAGLMQKEEQIQSRFDEKFKAAEAALKQHLQDEADKLAVDFERRKTDMENALKGKEQAFVSAFSEKEARLESEASIREKSALAAQEKAADMRQQEIESSLARRDRELDKKYSELSEKLNTQFRGEKAAWEAQKLSVLNADRQTLRSEFEKKEAALNQKFDDELARNRQEKSRMDEELSAKEEELEKTYYAELERSRAAFEKTKKGYEAQLQGKFEDLEKEQNRLTAWMLQKEEEYARKYQARETELIRLWEEKQAALEKANEARIKELETKLGGK